jgi:DNA-binding MarR family transcriptional regulator
MSRETPETPGIEIAPHVNVERLERLTDIIMQLQRCFLTRLSEELAAGQVSFAQFFLLGHLAGNESLSMGEIADRMQHTTAAATGLIDRLENLGYVERHPSALDRRKILVAITTKGTELVNRIREDMVQNLGKLSLFLTEEEQRMWLQIYEKIHCYCQTQAAQKI